MPLAPHHAEMEAFYLAPTSTPLDTTPRHRHPVNETLRHAQSADHSPVPRVPTSTDFDSFATELRSDLAPTTLLENVMSDRVVLAAWRLRRISLAEAEAARDRDTAGELPPIDRSVLRAECSLETALTILDAARSACRHRWGRPAPTSSKTGQLDTHLDGNGQPALSDPAGCELPSLSNEWTQVPGRDDPMDLDEEVDDSATIEPCWKGRLVFDDNVSTTSPVVRGTWVTVSQVVSLIVDGWTWSDVLRTHPELTEDDIRACLSYTIEQDNGDEL
jgi:uncharacterized protein (DUF433 family)